MEQPLREYADWADEGRPAEDPVAEMLRTRADEARCPVQTWLMPVVDDMDRCIRNIHMRNPNAIIIPICAKTGEGIEEWANWLAASVDAFKA